VKTHFRPYAPADFETLYSIDQRCYAPRIAYSRPELRQYLQLPGADCILAEIRPAKRPARPPRDSAAPAGPCVIGFCLTEHSGARGHIITMDVLEAFRRRGIGSQLLAEAERRLVEYGVREAMLEAAVNNQPAIAFWQGHGYRTRAILKSYYPGGRNALSMSKPLAGNGPKRTRTKPASRNRRLDRLDKSDD